MKSRPTYNPKKLIRVFLLCVPFTLAPLLPAGTDGDFAAPATISPEAKEALARYTRARRDAPLPAPDDIKGWKKVQAQIEKSRAEANAIVVRTYGPTIEERTLGGVPVLDIKPRQWKPGKQVLVYTHGGAYTLYSARSRLMSAVPMAADTGRRVVSIDYTLAPRAKWQQITDEAVAVIQALRGEGHDLSEIAIYGESAGGGLAAAEVLKMRDRGLGMPAAVVLWSPWADITDMGDTYATLQGADPLLFYPGNLKNCADAYAALADQKHPYVSPVYADYDKGYPPTLIQVGTKEIFLSNAVRLYRGMDSAGIAVTLDVYEGMCYIFQVFDYGIPEAKTARAKVRAFLDQHLGIISTE